MGVGGLGAVEILILLFVFLLVVGGPLAIIVLIILLINRRKNANVPVKKCEFCGYSIPVEATLCQFCGRELVNKTV